MNSAQIELSRISDSDREATLSQYDAFSPRWFNDLKTKFVQCDSDKLDPEDNSEVGQMLAQLDATAVAVTDVELSELSKECREHKIKDFHFA